MSKIVKIPRQLKLQLASFLLGCCSAFSTIAGELAELPAPVVSAIKDAGIGLKNVAVVVHGVDNNDALIRVNDRQAMNPASTMKVVTTFAALDLLGPAFTWKTEVFADAPVKNGRLNGNLYIKGSGDPRLALEQFGLLLRQLRARGLRDIDGDLVLDRSAFSLPPHNPGAFDNEPLRPYNTGPDALLVNLNSVRLTLHPDAEKQGITVIPETPSEPLTIDNRLKWSNEACGDWREKLKASVNSGTILLQGSFPASCNDKTLNLAPWAANEHTERLFRALWRELGGSLRGRVREGSTPATAPLIAAQDSPTLAEVVREINKYSNNVMARQLFLTLAADRPATTASARHRVDDWLSSKNIRIPELVLDNGSGLSRSERISADGLSRLLLAAWKSPVMPELMSSFPLAGTDGTLRKRLGNSPATGRAHLKTGYLEGVRALAGYVLDASNKRWVVVFLINDPNARNGKPAMDALLDWVANQ